MSRELSIIDIWQSIHANARFWPYHHDDKEFQDEQKAADGCVLSLLQTLDTIAPRRWIKLGEAAGWTPYGAVALSWCENVNMDDMFTAWGKALEGREPGDTELQPARLLNPNILPRPKLSAIIETDSYGARVKGLRYAERRSLIASGQFMQAFLQDTFEARAIAVAKGNPTKYDAAITQATAYASCLRAHGIVK